MKRVLNRMPFRVGGVVGVVAFCGVALDAIAAEVVHGVGPNKHTCWVCNPIPTPPATCQFATATFRITCQQHQCAYCGWANNSATMSCGSCSQGFED